MSDDPKHPRIPTVKWKCSWAWHQLPAREDVERSATNGPNDRANDKDYRAHHQPIRTSVVEQSDGETDSARSTIGLIYCARIAKMACR